MKKTTPSVPVSKFDDAHQIALELIKQLITLSSGVLALSATFIEKFYPESVIQIILLIASWACLAGSIYSGLQTISIIVQSRLIPEFDWSDGLGKKYAGASNYLFLAGIIFFALFALFSFLFRNLSGTTEVKAIFLLLCNTTRL